MKDLYIILLNSQLVFVLLVISTVWTYLYKKFKSDIAQTKLLLTNLHIDLILENKLTLQFFKNK